MQRFIRLNALDPKLGFCAFEAYEFDFDRILIGETVASLLDRYTLLQ